MLIFELRVEGTPFCVICNSIDVVEIGPVTSERRKGLIYGSALSIICR